MLATPCHEPFDGEESLFEIKHDGFRALAFLEGGDCRLLSRNGHRFSGFGDLEESLAQTLRGHTAVLDSEIVCLDGRVAPCSLRCSTDKPCRTFMRSTCCGWTGRIGGVVRW
jgi:ATP-dependent DNA ligase